MRLGRWTRRFAGSLDSTVGGCSAPSYLKALMRNDIAPTRASKPTPIVPGAPMDSRATLHHRLTSLVAGTNQQVRFSLTTNAAAFIIIYSLSR